jgi:hypothetical protein
MVDHGADHSMHHPDMAAGAPMTMTMPMSHTMPMDSSMDHSHHMSMMMQDMTGMMERMVEMHQELSFPTVDSQGQPVLDGASRAIVTLRNLAGVPLRIFTWTLQ